MGGGGMKPSHPDIEQLKRSIQEFPATIGDPDSQRLESILHKLHKVTRRKKVRIRNRLAYWWFLGVLFIGLVTAAVWHYAHPGREQANEQLPTEPSTPGQEDVDNTVDIFPDNLSDNPLQRQDSRFIPR